MSTIYLLTFIAAVAVVLALMLDSVIKVSRELKWESLRPLTLPAMSIERRSLNLAFVGAERRNANAEAHAAQDERVRKAA